jgi:DNA-binding transcriptional ArsR family regulator
MATKAHEPRLARVAAVVADPARSRMLCLLLSGEYATAGELAKAACVAPSTASEHLRKLLDAGLVAGESRGRHRYFRLADPQVAHALEALALVAERGSRDAAWDHPGRRMLRVARCCYGHLAGQIAVRLFGTLLERDALRAAADGYELTDAGRAWLSSLGMVPPQPGSRRRFAYACMDWSERRDHLAGQLASELFEHFIAKGWLRRAADRAIEVTPRGARELLPQLAGEMSRVA